MNYLGDYVEDGTLDFIWSTNNGSGASITRATNGTISVYKANSTTQTTAGITDTEDFDSLTGIHHCRIVLTDAFYTIANDYMIVLSAATIDGESVNAVLAHFSIENRYMVGTNGANTTTPPTAIAIRTEIDSNSTQMAAIVADTNELQTDDIPATLATIADYLDTEIAAILTDTDFLQILLAELITGTTPNRAFTVAALANAPSGGGGSAPTLANFFDTDSGETSATAVSGSVVAEIIGSITGGGSTEITDITINDGTNPLEGAVVWINTNSADSTANVLWLGNTNASGNPKDSNNGNPWLDAGTYYIWVQLGGYTFTNPTTLLVGAGPFTISGTVIASPGSVTAQQLIDQIQTDLADPTAATWSEADLLQWLNDAIRDFSLAHPRRRNTSLTAVSSQHKYTLPDDHIDTHSVEYPSAQTPPEYLLEKPYTDLDFWTNDDHYATIHNDDQEEDNELWIAATPAGGEGIDIEYAAYHPHTLAAADNTTVPIEFHHVLKVFVMARATEYLQMKEQATPTSSSSLLMSMLAQNAQQLRAEYDRRKQRGRRRRRRNREDNDA